ncbi:MAG: rnhA [Bacteriovoracaceae bacterium]|nr:rnhA [Bacteriovoracaceae bacterium]
MAVENKIIIFADGGCLGNPGPGGAGTIVADSKRVLELGFREASTTNNRMELMAVIQALEALEHNKWKASHVKFFCDSQYVLNGIQKWVRGWKRNGWKTGEGEDVKNRDLWEKLSELVSVAQKEFQIDWEYVPSHSGIPGNERCDEIATTLASGSEIFLYDGSRSEYSVDLTDLKPSKSKPASKKTAKTTASTYYISLVGGTVYRDKTWKECEARVKGARAAKYKKVNSTQEENETLQSWGVSTRSS